MNRRRFFRALGLSPVLIPAAVIATIQEANQDLAPDTPYISLVGKRVDNRIPAVRLGVGQDNKLWVKYAEEKWKRIATDEKILT